MALKVLFIYPEYESMGVEFVMQKVLDEGHLVALLLYNSKDDYTSRNRKVDIKKIAKTAVGMEPDVTAFSCVTNIYREQIAIANEIKNIKPSIINVFGGIHPTIVPERVIAEKPVDAIVVGEGETPFIEYLKNIELDKRVAIDGVIAKYGEDIIGDPKTFQLTDLSKKSMPFKEAFYQLNPFQKTIYRTVASRGCPYNCTYCANNALKNLYGNRYFRYRPVENVIEEISLARQIYGFRYVYFGDDSFGYDKRWLSEFSNAYEKSVGLPYSCIVNPMYLDTEKISMLQKSGCVHIQLGIQSLNPLVCRKILNRHIDTGHLAKVIRMLKDARIFIQADHIIGIPEEDLSSLDEAVDFYLENSPDVISVFWLTYFPSVAILNYARANGILSEEDIENICRGEWVGSIKLGGSVREQYIYRKHFFLMNYLTLLPGSVFRWLYRNHIPDFLTKSYLFSTGIPRFIKAFADSRNFLDKEHLKRMIYNIFHKSIRVTGYYEKKRNI